MAGGVRPAAGHGPVVQLEMAGKSAAPVLVALLGQHDLVDEPAAEGIGGGQPRHFDAAEPLLQRLEQGHEVPHGEDMVFHEQAQRLQPVDFPVNGMVQQCGPQRREPFLNDVQAIHRGFLFPFLWRAARLCLFLECGAFPPLSFLRFQQENERKKRKTKRRQSAALQMRSHSMGDLVPAGGRWPAAINTIRFGSMYFLATACTSSGVTAATPLRKSSMNVVRPSLFRWM